MAILSTLNLLSEQRLDISDVRRIESASRNDFDTTVTSIFTGTSQGYIIRGFSIPVGGSIGSPSSGLELAVDPGAVLHINASVSGTIFQTPIGTVNQVLNAATNPNVTGSFTASSTNYVGIDYNRFADASTNLTKYLWNSSSNDEITTIAPAAQTLTYKIIITTSVWAANVLPVAIVTTDGNGNVLSITDARWMLYSLETGGISPNPNYVYPWSEGRNQPPVTTTSNSQDPFNGGDKQLGDFKDWANSVMSTFLEIKGTPYWFSGTAGGGGGILPTLQSLLQDLGNTVITGSGEISNGILPNVDPILVTTGNTSSGSNQLTSLGSVAGLSGGDFVFGSGISTGTTIISISGSTITLSQVATISGTGAGITFYAPSAITTPGQVNWNDDINIRVVGSSLTYTIAANPSSSDIILTDDEAAYITLIRDVPIAPNLVFTSGSPIVTSVGAVTWTAGLLAGDYIKVGSNTVSDYYKILTIDSGSQVTLTTSVSAPDNSGPTGVKAQYAFGSYLAAATPTTNRNIYISSRETVPPGGNVFWLFLREDNGGNPRVYIRFLSMELDNGESVSISGTTSAELLKYIGSPSTSSSAPQYGAALIPGSLKQITGITIGAASTITSGQYFTINSAGNFNKYYVWFKKDGSGSSPAPLGLIGIEVDITTSQTSTQVATLLAAALNSLANYDFSATSGVGTITVTNTSSGVTTNAANVNVGTPFAIAISQTGTGVANIIVHDGDSLTLAIKELDQEFIEVDSELVPPGELIAQNPPSLVVQVGSGTIVNPVNKGNRTFPLIDNVAVNFAGGSFTFPSVTGNISVSPGSSTPITIGANQFVAILVQIDTNGNIILSVGAPAGSLGAVVVPGVSGAFLALGYVIVHSNGSSVIQSIDQSQLYQFQGGGAGSSSFTSFTIANNQSSPADVTEFLLDGSVTRGFNSDYSIIRAAPGVSFSLDTTFNTNTGTGPTNTVLCSAPQPDGKLVIGGIFSGFNLTGSLHGFARLNADGTFDSAFNTNLGSSFSSGGSSIHAVAIQSDGKILVGGTYTAFNGNTRNSIVRLNPDGTEDTTFYTNTPGGLPSGNVQSIVIQPDNKILVGGSFTGNIYRFNSDGTPDNAFAINAQNFDSGITALSVRSDGIIVVGGTFTTFNAVSRVGIMSLNANGTDNAAFSTNLGSGVNSFPESIVTQSDNKVVVGGSFNTFNGNTRNSMFRLNTDGTEDTTFYTNLGTGFSSDVVSIALQSGQILVGGAFSTVNGVSSNRLARINSDGTPDILFSTNLSTGFTNTIETISVMPNNEILVAGSINSFNGSTIHRIFRFTAQIVGTEVVIQGTIRGIYRPSITEWDIGAEVSYGDDVGVEFSITSGGQLQYTSTDIPGTTLSEMRFTINKL